MPCGYAPRAILASQNERSVFVGGKDGSVTWIELFGPPDATPSVLRVPPKGGEQRAVRALCELSANELLVGRSDGSVDRLILSRQPPGPRWDGPTPWAPAGESLQDAVRVIYRVDDNRVLVSRRYSGTLLLHLDRATPAQVLQPAGIHLAARREDRMIFATSRAELWEWNVVNGEPAQKRSDLWTTAARPGVVTDMILMPGDSPTLLVATDLGVYRVALFAGDQDFAFLPLPGLGPVCMSLAYARASSYGLLLASDTRGGSHLFWHSDPESSFLPAGVIKADSQVVLATAWPLVAGRAGSPLPWPLEGKDAEMVFVQAWQSDQVVFTYCRIVEDSGSSPPEQGPKHLRYLYLLREGTCQQLTAILGGAAGRETGASRWPERAVIADFFEFLAADDEGLQALRSFLSDPAAKLPARLLDEGEDAELALQLWTYTLLGIINRLPGERETLYLGLLRWLRDLEQRISTAELRVRVGTLVHKNLRFVRKWGLFGAANALRDRLVPPIEILRAQVRPGSESELMQAPEQLDLLTFETLLFHRGIDLLQEEGRGSMRGRTAWSVSLLDAKSGTCWLAVSWSLGGIELFELSRKGEGGDIGFDLHFALKPAGWAEGYYDLEPCPPAARRSTEGWRQIAFGYSRAILLGRVEVAGESDATFLLTAPALSSGAWQQEYVYLHRLDEGERLTATYVQCVALPEHESIYSLLEIEPGLFVAGLRGQKGMSTLMLLEVTAQPLALTRRQVLNMPREPTEADPAAAQALTTRAQNRAWSLSLLPSTAASELPQLFVGCEGGEIWQVSLAADRMFGKPEKAATMHSAVTALATSRVPTSGDGARARIIAGGSDGSLVAWQRLAGRAGESAPEEAANGKLVTLWATVERGGEIKAIHPIRYGGNGESLLLAVSRSGGFVLFDNCPEPEEPPITLQHPTRSRIPGRRRGRFQLPGSVSGAAATALASLQIEGRLPGGEPVWNQQTGRYAALLAASANGRVRLFSLHFPRWTAERKHRQMAILRQWWELLDQQAQGHPYERLRLADATFQSVSLIPLILARWFLDPSWEGAQVQPGDAERWLLPRYLRPLIDLRNAWACLASGDTARQQAAEALGALLGNARRLEDLTLFQEICSLVLKSANFTLVRAAQSRDDATLPCDFVLGLYQVIERRLQEWVGVSERAESRARIAVAKSLLDGDTFWQVLRRASTGEKTDPFVRVLDARIEGARQLIAKHDTLVSLEAIRAINLSLARLCKRFLLARGASRQQPVTAPVGAGWNPLDPEQGASWRRFRPFFEELVYAAARVFRSPLELTDALAHEYARTFALAVCACPSAAIQIVNGLTETSIISNFQAEQDTLLQRVEEQFELLDELRLGAPRIVRALFIAAARPPATGCDDPLETVAADFELWPAAASEPPDVAGLTLKVGEENAEDLHGLWLLYETVRWLGQLAHGLSSDASAFTLSRETVEKHLTRLQKDRYVTELYAHSGGFLKQALERLAEISPPRPLPTAARNIRPQMVLCSEPLKHWASEQVEALDKCYRDGGIFQPQYSIFRDALQRLQRAAEDFPRSAAVQKSIALAILGHHLIEELDEHVLELEEIAQTLDPLTVWRLRGMAQPGSGAHRASVAGRFADYLLQRASRAESIPKNLRLLYGVLETSQDTLEGEQLELGAHLLKPFAERRDRQWECGPLVNSSRTLAAREFQCLHLILSELDQNDRKYSGGTATSCPRVGCCGDSPLALSLTFSFVTNDDNIARLYAAMGLGEGDNNLQCPLDPQETRDVPSSGAGLYLANLAAAIVGWKLALTEIAPQQHLSSCTFRLTAPGGAKLVPEGAKGVAS